MEAILIATGYKKEMNALLQHRPTPLLHIADKPILYHILEVLSDHGVTSVHLILHHFPAMIEKAIGEGQRWGVRIQYYLCKDLLYPLDAIRPAIRQWPDGPILIGRGDSLPEIRPEYLNAHRNPAVTFYTNPFGNWNGWGILSKETLASLQSRTTLDTFYQQTHEKAQQVVIKPFLSTETYRDLIDSNKRFLEGTHGVHLFPSSAVNVEPGVWISRGVALLPYSKIHPPVFIGEGCLIKEHAVIGPHAIIENHSVIDRTSQIENSLICQNSYVGEGLELKESIVDRNLLINLEHGSEVHIVDDFILSSLEIPKMGGWLANLLERLIAFSFLILFSPIYLWLSYRCQKIETEMLAIPTPSNSLVWKTFHLKEFLPKGEGFLNKVQSYFHRLPYLLAILRGHLHFVGLPPRTIEEVKSLPEDWKHLYLKSKPGLITLERLDAVVHENPDQSYASELYYAASMSPGFDLRLFFRWARLKIADAVRLLFGRKTHPSPIATKKGPHDA